MKKRLRGMDSAGVAFRPALTPLEASVLPAWEKRPMGTLSMIRRAYDAGAHTQRQRTKI